MGPNLAEVDLCALIQAKSFVIFDNQILEQLSLPQPSTTDSLKIFDNQILEQLSLPQLSTTNSLEVFDNGNLQTLCAPNLVDGGSVCIGDENDQPSLDADLSSLVTGTFAGFSDDCYGRNDLFTAAGCSVTSKACKNTKKTKKEKKNKP